MKLKDWINKPMTIQELFLACEDEIKRSNKDKYIFISQDEEGNGFHALHHYFTTNQKYIKSYKDLIYQIDEEEDLEKIVLLG